MHAKYCILLFYAENEDMRTPIFDYNGKMFLYARKNRRKRMKTYTVCFRLYTQDTKIVNLVVRDFSCYLDLLSPLDCDYLTTDDSRLKRRSRSFSKADVHIFERRQEAMQKKEKLFREVDL